MTDLTVPEWVNQTVEVPRRTNYDLLENLLILIVTVIVLFGTFALGARHGESVGHREGRREGVLEICTEMPQSRDWAVACR